MGFDFLRDRLRLGAMPDDGVPKRKFSSVGGGEMPVQRGYNFALIDEADSILIDEARTPLIIGLTQPNDPATINLFRWSHRATFHLEANKDYVYEPDRRSAWLTDDGCRRVVLIDRGEILWGEQEPPIAQVPVFAIDDEFIRHPARLCTLATVRATLTESLARQALTRVSDTQGAVHEHFEGHVPVKSPQLA